MRVDQQLCYMLGGDEHPSDSMTKSQPGRPRFESIAANQPPGGQPDHEQDERLGKISSALQPRSGELKKKLVGL